MRRSVGRHGNNVWEKVSFKEQNQNKYSKVMESVEHKGRATV